MFPVIHHTRQFWMTGLQRDFFHVVYLKRLVTVHTQRTLIIRVGLAPGTDDHDHLAAPRAL
jgi:hypothetical protein